MKPTFRGLPLIVFTGLLTCLTLSTACNRNSFDSPSQTLVNNTYNQYEIVYQSTMKDSMLHFELEITKKGNLTAVIDEEFKIDLKRNKYLKSIYETLQERSFEYNDLTIDQAREICISLRKAIADRTKSLSDEEIRNPTIQGMYIGLSFARRILKNRLIAAQPNTRTFVNSTQRTSNFSINNSPDYQQPAYAQDVYEGYEVGLSGFVFNEDIIVNRQAFLNIVNYDAEEAIADDRGLYVFQAVLNSISAPSITLKDLLAEIDFYIRQHPENITDASGGCMGGWWPSGSSHGCCGNYTGCCWYWHPVCYIHDRICTNCNPGWFCLSGCIPDVTVALMPHPFTFIEDLDPENPPPAPILLPTTVPFDGIYYKENLSYLTMVTPMLYTPIYKSPYNNKYYANASFTNYVPNGYYDSPNEIDGYNHKYYHIVDGVVVQVYSVVVESPE